MIKIFRKIRQNLLLEGKTGRYFKYALGEIVLVMIGILLALQVNNWNELRKSKQAKNVYIDRLINELKADTTAFSFHIKNVKSNANDGKYIMSIINENKPIVNNKEFVLRLQNIGRVSIPRKANNSFLDLQSSGNLKLFNNDFVVNAVRSYYVTEVDFWYERYIERTTEGFLPIVTEVLPFKIGEEIIKSEMKENSNLSPSLNLEYYKVSVSNEDLELILEKIRKQRDFNFHLKNATRAHLLQIRFLRESYNQASDLIKLLKNYKE